MADESSSDVQAEAEVVRLAREEPAAVKLRENIFNAIQGVVQLWSLDAAVSHVCQFTCIICDTKLFGN